MSDSESEQSDVVCEVAVQPYLFKPMATELAVVGNQEEKNTNETPAERDIRDILAPRRWYSVFSFEKSRTEYITRDSRKSRQKKWKKHGML